MDSRLWYKIRQVGDLKIAWPNEECDTSMEEKSEGSFLEFPHPP